MIPLARYSPHAAQYTSAWRAVIEASQASALTMIQLDRYSQPITAQQARAEFLKALHKRISARDPKPYTAKQGQDYEASARRDQRRIRDTIQHRIRVYQFETSEARRRFSHLLASYQD